MQFTNQTYMRDFTEGLFKIYIHVYAINLPTKSKLRPFLNDIWQLHNSRPTF